MQSASQHVQSGSCMIHRQHTRRARKPHVQKEINQEPRWPWPPARPRSPEAALLSHGVRFFGDPNYLRNRILMPGMTWPYTEVSDLTWRVCKDKHRKWKRHWRKRPLICREAQMPRTGCLQPVSGQVALPSMLCPSLGPRAWCLLHVRHSGVCTHPPKHT